MNIEIILGCCLIISILLNVLGVVYLRRVVPRLLFISQNIDDLIEIIATYRAHLKAIFEMESFYGEPILENLLNHTKSLSLLLEEYEDLASISEAVAYIEEGETNDNEEATNQEDNEENQTQKIVKENVFYAGSRRRNS